MFRKFLGTLRLILSIGRLFRSPIKALLTLTLCEMPVLSFSLFRCGFGPLKSWDTVRPLEESPKESPGAFSGDSSETVSGTFWTPGPEGPGRLFRRLFGDSGPGRIL